MTRAHRRDPIGPPSVLLGAALLLTAVLPASGHLPGLVAASHAGLTDCALAPAQAAQASVRNPQRSDPVVRELLTNRGELIGQSISFATRAGRAIEISVPPESFVGRERGGLLLLTTHGEVTSEVHALDMDSGCVTVIARIPDIARSALLSPDAESLYVHLVTRGERADAGVVRHDLATSVASVVLKPLSVDDSFGPIFATQLSWSVDGTTLAVQSCGFQRCQTRLVETGSGASETYAEPDHGQLIGVTRDHVVAFSDCPGRPCAVLAIGRGEDLGRTLAGEACSASLESHDDGLTIVSIETAAGIEEIQP